MAFDGITARCTYYDLETRLLGARVDKIHMPSPEEVLLHMRSLGKSCCLLLNINTANCRVQLTENKAENPKSPLNFCMVLRKYLGGGRLINIRTRPYDRVFLFDFETTTEMGDKVVRSLAAEIMGKHSNIVLISEGGTCIDAIKHVDSSVNTYREVLPMRRYEMPPEQDKISPEQMNVDALQFDGNTSLRNLLIGTFMGISPLIANEIAFRTGVPSGATSLSDEERARLQDVLVAMSSQLSQREFTPCLVRGETVRKTVVEYSAITLTQYGDSVQHTTDLRSAVDAYYKDKDIKDRLSSVRGGCARQVRQAITRCNNKIKIQETAISQSADMDNLKLNGDLITASMYMIKGGESEVLLPNYYGAVGEDGTPEMVKVKLDPTMSPQKNAQNYYKRYNKAKRTMATASQQLINSEAELDYLEQTLYMLDQCESMNDVLTIREELVEEGYIRNKRKVPAKKNPKQANAPQLCEYMGYEILIGRNSSANHHLTLHLASSNDMWFHAKNVPGSHVVVRKQQGEIPDEVLIRAAEIAAYYSKAADSGKVSVDYTKIKNVHRHKSGRPGMVNYDNYYTLVVTPGSEVKSEK